MNYKKLKEKWLEEENYAFEGWNFSHIDGRYEEEKLPWDYKDIVLNYINKTDKLLDMGTGGGEFLLSLNHIHGQISVTEAYLPNVELCKEKLMPLGITVAQVNDDKLPFKKDSFDIIINRHESFDALEINRVLKDSKLFITQQQVGGLNNIDLSKRILDNYEPQYSNHTLKGNIKELEKLKFELIYSEEAFIPIKFFDVGAFVYFAKIIEWEFPDLSVEKYFNKLYKFQKEIDNTGFIEGTEHRFINRCKKS